MVLSCTHSLFLPLGILALYSAYYDKHIHVGNSTLDFFVNSLLNMDML